MPYEKTKKKTLRIMRASTHQRFQSHHSQAYKKDADVLSYELSSYAGVTEGFNALACTGQSGVRTDAGCSEKDDVGDKSDVTLRFLCHKPKRTTQLVLLTL